MKRFLETVLPALDHERLTAGVTRDGTASARIGVIVRTLDAICAAFETLDGSWAKVSDLRDRTRATGRFCAIHDALHRGEIDGAECERRLAAERTEQWGNVPSLKRTAA